MKDGPDIIADSSPAIGKVFDFLLPRPEPGSVSETPLCPELGDTIDMPYSRFVIDGDAEALDTFVGALEPVMHDAAAHREAWAA